MSTYKIKHITRYTYASTVIDCTNQIMLYPIIDSQLEVRNHEIKISHNPVVEVFVDYFGNHTGVFSIIKPHTELLIESIAEVVTRPIVLPEDNMNAAEQWQELSRIKNDMAYMDFLKQEAFTSSADVKKLFAAAKTAYGKLDILVNNAGVYKFDPIETITEEEFHRQFNTNVLGTILATQEALQHFNGEGGSVINVSSVVSDNPMANSVVYSATKGAVDTIAVALSKELGAKNIRVNTLAPGGVDTEGAHTLGMIGSDLEKQLVASTPLGRIGQPDDIAKVAVFLGSNDSGWINGQKITVSGGFR